MLRKISKIHHLNAKINRWSKKFKQWPVVEDEGNKAVSYFLRVNQPCTKVSKKKVGHRVDQSCTKSLKKGETLRKIIIAKIAKSENCKNCEKLRKKVSKSETLRKIKTAKIAKTFTIHYTAVIFQKKKYGHTKPQKQRWEYHRKSYGKPILRGSEIQKSAIEPLRKMR